MMVDGPEKAIHRPVYQQSTLNHQPGHASVVKLLSSSASNGEFAGGSPAGCTNLRACGSTRIAEGPDSESGSLGGAIPFMPTSLRSKRSKSGAAAPKRSEGGPRVPASSFGPASHFAATGFSGNSRPRRLKIAEPSGCKSRVADQPSLFELRLGEPACG